jgi:IS5 family transposase
MVWRKLKQKSLIDARIVEHAANRIDDVIALLDWSRLEAQLISIHNKASGEKAWQPLMMFKAMLLKSW